jgi:hypothetical protein
MGNNYIGMAAGELIGSHQTEMHRTSKEHTSISNVNNTQKDVSVGDREDGIGLVEANSSPEESQRSLVSDSMRRSRA